MPVQSSDICLANVSGKLTVGDVEQIKSNPAIKIVQHVAPMPAKSFQLLNDILFAARPEVWLRSYGHYSAQCDLEFLRLVPNVRSFAADCLQDAMNVCAIADLPHLRRLSLGIRSLDSFDILGQIPRGVSELRLGATKSTKPDLGVLERFSELRELYIEGHRKGLAVLRCIRTLEQLTLRSITLQNLEFVADLPSLWSLDLKLGGVKDLSGLVGKKSIKYLELWMAKGLADLSPLSGLVGLQNLFLQALRQVKELPDLSGLEQLRRVVLLTMKGLLDVQPLASAPCLEDVGVYDLPQLEPEAFVPILERKSVRRVSAFMGSNRKNSEFDDLRRKYGKDEFDGKEFVYL